MSIISSLLGEFVFFKHLTKWTMLLTDRHLIYHVPVIDAVIFRLYPLIVGTALLLADKNVSIKKCVFTIILAFPSIIILLLTVFFTGIFLIWPAAGSSSYSASFITQPFRYYWTPLILAGIFTPVLLVGIRKERKTKNEQIIDN